MIVEILPNEIFKKKAFLLLFVISVIFLILSIILITSFIKNYENQRKKAKAYEIYGIKKPSLVFVSISIFFGSVNTIIL